MKTKLFFSLLLTSSISWSQSSEVYIDYNNAKGLIGSSGSFFNNSGAGSARGYEIPKSTSRQSKVFAISEMNLVMEGKNSANELYGFSKGDLFAGPIEDYLSAYYNGGATWKITKAEILTHISDFSNPAYVIPEVILKWPANGNVNLGEGSKLAPFIDLNKNSIYEPNLGDYPAIKGDQAVYVIMNDANGVRVDAQGNSQNTFGKQVGMEIHVMSYQYGTTDAINNTTFFNVKAFNKGNIDLHDVVFGIKTDFDLGNPLDDYVGSDSLRRMIFAYNGDDIDENISTINGYGVQPPAIGVKYLSELADGTVVFDNYSNFPYSDPTSAVELSNCLLGNWGNGSNRMYGGKGNGNGVGASFTPNNFMYSGDTPLGNWTENTTTNTPGDRRALIYGMPIDIAIEQEFNLDFAIIFSGASVNSEQQIDSLAKVADFVQDFYNKQPIVQDYSSQQNDIDKNSLGIVDLKTQIEYSVHPNPTKDYLTVNVSKAENFVITVENSVGQTVKTQKVDGGITAKIDLSDVVNGIYILKINGSNAMKIVKN